jgi:hypothetical protein
MGGKNDDAPAAPDYSELANASKESAQYSYELAKRQQDWAEKTYAENKDVTDSVVDWAMGQMDKEAAWADADRKRYEDIYQPLEDQYAQKAQDYASAERQEVEAGKAEADVAAQFNAARQAAQDRLEQFGVDPSQTRQGALDLGTRVAEAAAQAGAGNQARSRTEQIGNEMLSNAINTGKGYAQQVIGEAGAASQSGNQAANTTLAQTSSGSNTMGTGQSWQGQGNSSIGTWGNILNAGFSNAMDSYKANQENSSGWGSILGQVAGTALGKFMMAEGGVIPEFADGGMPIPEEASPSNGAIPDDVPAQIDGAAPARLNAGEFVVPKDVVSWLGEKGMQQVILKARKEMQNGNGERPAQPDVQGPPPPPVPAQSVGAIPEPQGV